MVKAIIKSIKISITSLLANKARSFLTMLGIIIGIGAVIIIMAVGASAQNLVLTQIKSLGTNLIGILPGHSEKESPLNAFTGFSVTTLTYDDAMALRDKKNVPNIVDVVAYNKSAGTAVWSLNSYDTNLSGITVGYLKVEGGEVKIGRFFTRE
ncbi:MAG TPA: ABC transporter permease, partial [Candidatus Wolfebacteria bacterium]|nr:ABC transporter permease [Candidatus Wolfebacteria bacterium]